MSHPLCGANLKTLFHLFSHCGAIAPENRKTAALIWGSALARAPTTTLEKWLYTPFLPKVEEIPPPLFILGHWRSGTTHLYNTMVKSDQFGYVDPVTVGLPWDMFTLIKTLRPLLERTIPRDRYIDNIPVTPNAPQEDEIALASMTTISFYHAIYFPKQFDKNHSLGLYPDQWNAAQRESRTKAFTLFMRKLYKQQGKRLLIKNPVYTACPSFLKEIFPTAKFIHIHRNPFDVCLSMHNFYQKLLPVFALQEFGHLDIDHLVLHTYAEMMQRFERETKALKAPDFVEIGYDTLSEDPIASLDRIYSTLALDGFNDARPAFERYLRSVKSYQKNTFKGTLDMVERVQETCGHFIEKWGYTPPKVIG